MDHRRTVTRPAFVPPVWLITVTVMAIVLGLGVLGWLAYDATSDDRAETATTPASSTPAPSPEPSPTPEPTPDPTPEPTPEPVADRSPGVSILNGTSINGLAASIADRLRGLGWDDVRTGDTRGVYPENTVYYPPQFEEQARTLAADLGIERVHPRVEGLRRDRLTVVVISQPSSVQ